MSIWDRLRAAFGGGATEGRDNGLYFYVRCERCGERVRVRLNPSSELQQEFGESGESAGYFVRKMVVDQGCFRPIEVRLRFDASWREVSREIEGGTFLTAEEYDAPG